MQTMGKKRLVSLMLAAVMLLMAACSVNMGEEEPKAAEPGTKGAETKSGAQKDVFWHAMGGATTKVVDQLVDNFNKSQDKIQVEAVYQGTYDDLLSKLKASMGTSEGPTVVQMYEIGSRFMVDSKLITPMQNFIDQDGWDVGQLEPNISGYYTFDDKLYSMPFNTSNPILYYNKDLFKEAGLDPENPPKTFEELKTAADKISKTGKAVGANFAIYGWFMEQFFANQGAEYVNNGNGRDDLATESLVNSDAGVKVMTWWKDLIDTKAANNLGRKTDDSKKRSPQARWR